MIDFRYHLVSIVAVFLALAIGIVLGSTELQGNALNLLNSTSNSLRSQYAAASSERDAYAAQASAGEQFAQAEEPTLLASLLKGDRIVLITEPGAQDSVISGVKQAAADAGATVTGQISLQPRFNDTSGETQSALSSTNGSAAQAAGVSLSTSGANQQTFYQQQAAQLIASAILTTSASAGAQTSSPANAQTSSQTSLPASAAQALLSSYAQAGFLSVSGQPTVRATLAVVITPQSPPSDGASDPASQVLVTLTQQLAGASAATVVAGGVSGSGTASAMGVLRSSDVSSRVSTIDDADTTFGQITVIQALATQLAGGKAASYGVDGATGIGPTPAPTPSASVSPSSAPAAKSTAKAKTPKGKK
ncbi:MAG: copper transporter [Streptosporangiaceae bacterium]|nr:copper transporter [Streptosporangiaceae bacterium]MBV9855863.1 copper transporter [Streptosporangiaceae bacterium]